MYLKKIFDHLSGIISCRFLFFYRIINMVGLFAVSRSLRVMSVGRHCGHQLQSRARISVTRVACLAQGFEKQILQEGSGSSPTKGQKVCLRSIYFLAQ